MSKSALEIKKETLLNSTVEVYLPTNFFVKLFNIQICPNKIMVSPVSYTFIKNKAEYLFYFIMLILIPIHSRCQQIVLDFSIYDRQKLGPTLMESTFFVYQPTNKNNAGTAFILGHVLEIDSLSKRVDSVSYKLSQKTIYRYSKFKYCEILITAAHVFQNIEGDYANISLRRRKNNNYETFDYPLRIRQDGNQLWTQVDKGTDVAAMVVVLPEIASYSIIVDDYLFFKDDFLDQIQVNAGSALSCIGFPYNTPSDNRNFPIIRSGIYASFRGPHSANDPYFLFDFRIYPGNSGGPVFVDSKSVYNNKAEGRVLSSGIIGVISEQLKSVDSTHYIDVAKVIPSRLIYETIIRINRTPTNYVKVFDENKFK